MQQKSNISKTFEDQQSMHSNSQQNKQYHLQTFASIKQRPYPQNKQQVYNFKKQHEANQNQQKQESYQNLEEQNKKIYLQKYVKIYKDFEEVKSMKQFCLLNQNKINNKQFSEFTAFLQNLQSLTFINCNGVDLTLSQNLQKIKRLTFKNTNLSELIIKDLPQLRELTIQQSNPINIINIVRCSSLQYLLLSKVSIMNLNLQCLDQLKTFQFKNKCFIQNAKLYKCDFIENISQTFFEIRQQLQTLQINCLNWNSQSFGELLEKISSLKTLIIKNCPKIEYLNIYSQGIVQIQLHNMQNLKFVGVYFIYSLQRLIFIQCEAMKTIQFQQSKISHQLIDALINNIPQNLQFLIIKRCRQLQRFILRKHENLKNITIQSCDIKQLNIQGLSSLQCLRLNFNYQMKSIRVKNCHIIRNIQLNLQSITREPMTFKNKKYQQDFKNELRQAIKQNHLQMDFNENLKQFIIQSIILSPKQVNSLNLSHLQRLIIQKSCMIKIKELNQLQQLQEIKNQKIVESQETCQQYKKQASQFVILNLLEEVANLNFYNLRILQLRQCRINNIQMICFLDFSNLQKLDLQYNFIWSTKTLRKAPQCEKALSMKNNPFNYVQLFQDNSVVFKVFRQSTNDDLNDTYIKSILKIQSRNSLIHNVLSKTLDSKLKKGRYLKVLQED